MSDKKNVQLTDLAEKAPDEVKGGTLSTTTDFASVNIRPLSTSVTAPEKIDVSKFANTTTMCPW